MAFLRTQLMQTMRRRFWGDHTFPAHNTVIQASTTVYVPSTTDGPIVWEFHRDLAVESGALMTPSNRCKGFGIVVNGDLTLDGKISMTARGAAAVGDNLALDYGNAEVLVNPSNFDEFEYTIGSTGGAQTSYRTSSGAGYNGNAAVNYACGSGGSGGGGIAVSGSSSGRGATATSYSGGAGGGGVYANNGIRRNAGHGAGNGGAGGNGASSLSTRHAGGGAGNGGGSRSGSGATNGQSGTGGLLIMFVNGNVTINEDGVIEANGMRGGGGEYNGGSGGGSGGGSINILYTGEFINNGTITANGGGSNYGGTSPVYRGGYGGAGTVRVAKVKI